MVLQGRRPTGTYRFGCLSFHFSRYEVSHGIHRFSAHGSRRASAEEHFDRRNVDGHIDLSFAKLAMSRRTGRVSHRTDRRRFSGNHPTARNDDEDREWEGRRHGRSRALRIHAVGRRAPLSDAAHRARGRLELHCHRRQARWRIVGTGRNEVSRHTREACRDAAAPTLITRR